MPIANVSPLFRLVTRRSNSLVAMNDGVGFPFYCVHPIGGDVKAMMPLGVLLGQFRLIGVQVPANCMNAAFASSVEAVAAYHVAAIVAAAPEGPIAIGGWSAGAVIALEMARLLVEAGCDVPLLVAFDGGPVDPGAGYSTLHPRYLSAVVGNWPRWIRERFAFATWSEVCCELRRSIVELVKRKLPITALFSNYHIDDHAVFTIAARNGLRVNEVEFIHALYAACLRYRPRKYPGHVVLYECVTQPLFHLRQLAEVWRRITPSVEIVRVTGRHGHFFKSPNIDFVAKDLAHRLHALAGR